ncbi:MAG: hypothetical protein ACKN9T_16920 [Candidatus Methylumidiphilus sp.]
MADERKSGKLILDNLAMFKESVELFEQQIQPEVFTEIRSCIESWANQNGWICGALDRTRNDSWWIAPASWRPDGHNGLPNVWFGFCNEARFEGSFNLAKLCGCGQDRLGFSWWGNTQYLGLTNAQLKTFCRNFPPEKSRKLTELGWHDRGNWIIWFMPVSIDSAKLGTAYENQDYKEALQPLLQTLEKLKTSQAIFDEILNLHGIA